jgi:Arc/MetJ family transcription regulator
MKMHIDLDEELVDEVRKMGKHATKKEAVNAALKEYRDWLLRQELLAMRGKFHWKGDLDQLRGRVRRAR